MKTYTPVYKAPERQFADVKSAWVGLPAVMEAVVKEFQIPTNRALEFGVEWGYSTSALANIFDRVVGVDTFTGDPHSGNKADHFVETYDNLQEWDNIQLVQMDYQTFCADHKEMYDLIHIDIIHTYEATYACGAWAVQNAKCVIFHDTESFPDVKRAVQDLATNFGLDFWNFSDLSVNLGGLGILTKFSRK
jgi:hypothetical protein